MTGKHLLHRGLTLWCLCSLMGCAATAGGIGATGATVAAESQLLQGKRADIRVTDESKDIADCRFIKKVQAQTFGGGLFLQSQALENSIDDLARQAVQAEANVLLIRYTHRSFWRASSEGDAYRCPGGSSVAPPTAPTPDDGAG